MADPTITFQLPVVGEAPSNETRVNLEDLRNYITARNDGTTPWDNLQLENANAVTHLIINNTLADGDPVICWQLSGTAVATMGIDDGDSDKLKIGSTAIGTQTVLEIIPTAAPHVKVLSDDAVTELAVDNTATDGDSVISFQLSGTAIATMGIDDGDSDKFKIGSTAIGAETALEIIPTAAPQVKVISDDAITELAIDNTATDGDSVLSFELGGTAQFTMGVDDGDSDIFKIGSTAIGTETFFSAGAAGAGVDLNAVSGDLTLSIAGTATGRLQAAGLIIERAGGDCIAQDTIKPAQATTIHNCFMVYLTIINRCIT